MGTNKDPEEKNSVRGFVVGLDIHQFVRREWKIANRKPLYI